MAGNLVARNHGAPWRVLSCEGMLTTPDDSIVGRDRRARLYLRARRVADACLCVVEGAMAPEAENKIARALNEIKATAVVLCMKYRVRALRAVEAALSLGAW